MSRNNWWGLIASVVTVLVALGLLALLSDDDPPRLPDRVGGMAAQEKPVGESQERLYTAAFDTTAIALRSYVTSDRSTADLRRATVVVVRQKASPLRPDGLDASRVTKVVGGDVECLVERGRLKKGRESASSFVCQRTAGRLTVLVNGTGPEDADAVGFVNAVWDEVD